MGHGLHVPPSPQAGYIGEVLGGMVLWQLWSEILLDWSLTKRYWFDTLAGLLASVLFFYSMVLGLENLTPEGLASLGLDLGPLLLVFAAFNLVVGTFQSIAYSVQSEAALGTLEHLGLARGGLLRQLLLRALVQGLAGITFNLLTLLPLVLLLGVRLTPASLVAPGPFAPVPRRLGLRPRHGGLGPPVQAGGGLLHHRPVPLPALLLLPGPV